MNSSALDLLVQVDLPVRDISEATCLRANRERSVSQASRQHSTFIRECLDKDVLKIGLNVDYRQPLYTFLDFHFSDMQKHKQVQLCIPTDEFLSGLDK